MTLLHQPKIVDVAAKCGITPAQICLSWLRKRGVRTIPKTIREYRLEENIQLAKLSEEDFEAIGGLHRDLGEAQYLSVTGKIGFGIFDKQVDQPV